MHTGSAICISVLAIMICILVVVMETAMMAPLHIYIF